MSTSMFVLGPFDRFRLGSDYKVEIKLKYSKYEYNLKIEIQDSGRIIVKLPDGSEHSITIINHENNRLMTLIDKEMSTVNYYIYKDTISLWTNDLGRFDFKLSTPDYTNFSNNENRELLVDE